MIATHIAPWFIRIEHEHGPWRSWPNPTPRNDMPKQLEIAGTEAPKNEDIENAIDMWLDAKEEQRRSSETTKLRHQALLLHMQNAGIDVYPFTDRTTNKKKQVVIARDPKAKTLKQPRWNRRDADADEPGEEVEVTELNDDTPPPDNVVEMRRVKRTAAHDAVSDPFASTRAAMEEGDVAYQAPANFDAVLDQAVDVIESEPAPKKRKGKAKR